MISVGCRGRPWSHVLGVSSFLRNRAPKYVMLLKLKDQNFGYRMGAVVKNLFFDDPVLSCTVTVQVESGAIMADCGSW